MKKRIKIEGMSCEHCSNAVKNVLEELGGVDVKVSHESGIAEADIDADNALITEKFSEEDFDVISIENI